MRYCRLTLGVMFYLMLDFATPMLPGAVQFVGASLEVVESTLTLRSEVPAPTLGARRLIPVVERAEPARREPRWIASPGLLSGALVRSALEPNGSASSRSSDDD